MKRTCIFLWAGLVAACDPPQDLAPYQIQAPRILAVRTVPAQVNPDRPVKREVLAVDALGEPLAIAPSFARCELPKPLGERSFVSQACMLGYGLVATGQDAPVDSLACQRFGPTPAPQKKDEPAARPVPPDQSGGYYSPEKVWLPGTSLEAFFRIRTRCDLLGSTRDVFDAFEAQYQPNQSPDLASATLLQVADPSQAQWQLFAPIGTPITLSLQVPATMAQEYIKYELTRNELVPQREQLTLRWFASGASLQRSEQSYDGLTLDRNLPFENTLTLGASGRARVWMVLEDDRGGRSWRSLLILAQPLPATP